MSKSLIFSDMHLKGYKEKQDNLSRWNYEMQKYSIDKLLSIIKEKEITSVKIIGDLLDDSYPKDFELKLVDYLFSNIPKEVSVIILDGNHELDRESSKRIYYWQHMKEYYKEKYSVRVVDFEEIGQDLYCSHRHIDKLQHLTKKYRFVYSHIRASDGDSFYSDEINMSVLKRSAGKVILGDIHKQLEFDNVIYCGQSSWVNFPKKEILDDEISNVPSALILDETNGEIERVELFDESSHYRKITKYIPSDDFERIDDIIAEMRQEHEKSKCFFKVVIYAKKFMLNKLRKSFADCKDFCVFDFHNTTLKEHIAQNTQIKELMKESLDKKSVSENLLEFIIKINDRKDLNDKISSIFSTLEGELC